MEVVVAEELADLGGRARPVSGDGVARPGEPRIALAGHVQQVTWAWPLVAATLPPRRPGRPRAAVATQDRVNGRVGHTRLAGEQPRPPPRALTRLHDQLLDRQIGATRR